MNERNKQLRDALLASEPIRDELKLRYEKEKRAMFEQKLTAPRKWGMVVLTVIMFCLFIIFSYAAFASDELPLLARMSFVLGIVFSLAFAVMLINVLRKGSYNLRSDANAQASALWIFFVLFITIMMMLGGRMEDKVTAVQMVLNATVFLLMGVAFLLKNAVEQSELKTREKLLEIEYQLSLLTDKKVEKF